MNRGLNMKNSLIFTIFLIGLSFACYQINVSEFANQSINLTTGCYLIIDDATNKTFQINYVENIVYIQNYTNVSVPMKYNLTIKVNPEQSITHNETNITCVGASIKQNQTIEIIAPYNFTDNILNNTYQCKLPTWNLINQSIQQNQSYFNQQRNIYISCQEHLCPACQAPLIINKSLNYGECISNSSYNNISICAPQFPKINQIIYQNYSEDYTIPLFNLTVLAPPYPKLNISRILSLGECYENEDLNQSLCALGEEALKQNNTININAGDTATNMITNTLYNCKKDNLGIYKELSAQESYDNNERGIYVKCGAELIKNITCDNILENINITNMFMQYNNGTCTRPIVSVCSDSFLLMNCTPLETLNGDMAGCINRIKNETLSKLEICEEKLNNSNNKYSTCAYQITQYQNTEKKMEDIATQKVLYPILALIGGVGAYMILVYVERRGGNNWPKFGGNSNG